VVCSGGTYVRSLAADLGRALGTLAHLATLRRTAVGRFTERDAHSLAELEGGGPGGLKERSGNPPEGGGKLAAAVLDPAAAMATTPTRDLDADEAAALANGRALEPTGRPGPVAAVGPDGRLVAVVEDRDGRARPRVVLA
jgi:tRNA pseudouridine55 synthase